MSAEHNKIIVLRYYQKFDQGDLEQVEDMLASVVGFCLRPEPGKKYLCSQALDDYVVFM